MFPAKIEFIVRQMVGGVDSTPFIAVPLFVLSGIIMARGGVSDKLFNMFSYFAGDKTGGLPCAVVVTCLFYGAISGSGPATVAAIGAMSTVSYTHLDVYKRQAYQRAAVEEDIGRHPIEPVEGDRRNGVQPDQGRHYRHDGRDGAFARKLEPLGGEADPVSYTHLDVYKRQPLAWPLTSR